MILINVDVSYDIIVCVFCSFLHMECCICLEERDSWVSMPTCTHQTCTTCAPVLFVHTTRCPICRAPFLTILAPGRRYSMFQHNIITATCASCNRVVRDRTLLRPCEHALCFDCYGLANVNSDVLNYFDHTTAVSCPACTREILGWYIYQGRLAIAHYDHVLLL
jgi:hypothetical protein